MPSVWATLTLFWLLLLGMYTPFLIAAGVGCALAVTLMARRMRLITGAARDQPRFRLVLPSSGVLPPPRPLWLNFLTRGIVRKVLRRARATPMVHVDRYGQAIEARSLVPVAH